MAMAGLVHFIAVRLAQDVELFIELQSARLGSIAATAIGFIIDGIGFVPWLVAGAVFGILLAMWLWSGPRGRVRRTISCFGVLIMLAFGGLIWLAHVEEPPKATWIFPDKAEPEGSSYRTFFSKTIEGEVSYLIYLPDEYADSSDKRYPVVYYLPGGSGRQTNIGRILPRLKSAMKSGLIRPVIVVGVNGISGSSYRDPPMGRVPIESVIIKDLIPHIDETYRTISRPDGRTLEGGSMGGFGSLYLGLKHPQIFGAVFSDNPPFYSGIDGIDELLSLARNNADAIRGKMKIRFVGGKHGGLSGARRFHKWLEMLSIPHEYMEDAGGVRGFSDKSSDKLEIEFFQQVFPNIEAH